MISNNCNIEISEKGENILVKITSPIYDPLKTPRIRIDTRDIANYLENNGYPSAECVEGCSFSNRNSTEASWIFSKKTLDKPAEKVILSKEKKAAPKKKSKAKKKDK